MSLFDEASLIITPNAYKEGKIFAIKPTDGSGDLSVVRATTATDVNSAGLIEDTPYNLLQRSEEFSNAIWNKTGSTITANATIAPNGTLTADKSVLTNGIDPLSPSGAGLAQNQTIPSGVYIYSIFAKAGERNIIRWRDGGFSGNYLVVNLLDGTFTNGEPTRFVNPQVIPYDNGWYRIIFTTGTITNPSVYPLRFGTTGQIGDGVSGGFVWGAQIVTGSSARDYFPTTDRLNVPRLDYTNSTCPSILVEPQRTNLVLRSEEFDNASWVKNGTTISSNTNISPSGIQNADKIVENNLLGIHIVQQVLTLVVGTTYSVSCFLKAGERNRGRIRVLGSSAQEIEFNLQNGTSTGGFVQDFGNGWYRIGFTFVANAISSSIIIFLSDSTTGNSGFNYTYTGNGTSGFFAWGCQLELGSNATSYIPTVASTVTRNADVISKTGISDLIGQTEGTVFVEFNLSTVGGPSGSGIIEISPLGGGDSETNRVLIWKNTGSKQILFQIRAGSTTNIFNFVFSAPPDGKVKVGIAYKSGDTILSVNGSIVARSETFNFSQTLNFIKLGSYSSTNIVINDTINQCLLFKTRLSNAELIQLTTL
jgi:hypothetical protein